MKVLLQRGQNQNPLGHWHDAEKQKARHPQDDRTELAPADRRARRARHPTSAHVARPQETDRYFQSCMEPEPVMIAENAMLVCVEAPPSGSLGLLPNHSA